MAKYFYRASCLSIFTLLNGINLFSKILKSKSFGCSRLAASVAGTRDERRESVFKHSTGNCRNSPQKIAILYLFVVSLRKYVCRDYKLYISGYLV
jgi:hypothetical protein